MRRIQVIDDTGFPNCRKDVNKIGPHPSLIGWRVRPKRILCCRGFIAYPEPNKIVKLLVRVAFDVQVDYGRLSQINRWAGGQVDLVSRIASAFREWLYSGEVDFCFEGRRRGRNV